MAGVWVRVCRDRDQGERAHGGDGHALSLLATARADGRKLRLISARAKTREETEAGGPVRCYCRRATD